MLIRLPSCACHGDLFARGKIRSRGRSRHLWAKIREIREIDGRLAVVIERVDEEDDRFARLQRGQNAGVYHRRTKTLDGEAAICRSRSLREFGKRFVVFAAHADED